MTSGVSMPKPSLVQLIRERVPPAALDHIIVCRRLTADDINAFYPASCGGKVTPLLAAVLDDRPDYVSVLLDHGADVTKRTVDGLLVLRYTVFSDKQPSELFFMLVEMQAAVGHIDTDMGHGLPVAHHAALLGQWDVLATAVHLGADVAIRAGKSHCTPLISAIARHIPVAYLDGLVTRDNVNLPDALGKTPLITAIRWHHWDAGLVLIQKYGADVNCPGKKNATPMHVAARLGRWDIVESLITFGGDVGKRDVSHDTPLHKALQSKKRMPTECLLKLISDENINSANKRGNTPLDLILKSENWSLISEFKERGADFTKLNYGSVNYGDRVLGRDERVDKHKPLCLMQLSAAALRSGLTSTAHCELLPLPRALKTYVRLGHDKAEELMDLHARQQLSDGDDSDVCVD